MVQFSIAILRYHNATQNYLNEYMWLHLCLKLVLNLKIIQQLIYSLNCARYMQKCQFVEMNHIPMKRSFAYFGNNFWTNRCFSDHVTSSNVDFTENQYFKC